MKNSSSRAIATLVALSLAALCSAGCGVEDVPPTGSITRAALTLCPTTTPCTDAASCRGRITVDGRKVPYYRNFALGVANSDITRAVIMVHGINRNADTYFETTVASANQAISRGVMSCALRRSLLIAPQFQNGTDSAASDELVWSGSGWVRGDASTTASGAISAYRVIDTIIARLGDTAAFPNLRTIVLAGHSAGGQLVQRYAAGGKQLLSLPSHLQVRIVPANPSSYLYLYDYRLVPGTTSTFRVPVTSHSSYTPRFEFLSTFATCTVAGDSNGFRRYRRYHYGTDVLNPYMLGTGVGVMRTAYALRDVVYLLGTMDNKDNGNMDTTCPAALQGPHRLARGETFNRFMHVMFPWTRHHVAYAYGIGHDNRAMFSSINGVGLLFN